MNRQDRLGSLSLANRIAAALVVLASLLLPPGLYGIAAFTNVIADMEADARVAAETVQQLIRDSPGPWQENTNGLDAITAGWFHFDEANDFEQLRIVGLQGRALSVIGLTPAWPRIMRSAPVTENGLPAGAVEIERSLRQPILITALLALIGLALAAGAYVTFYRIPLRTLRQQNARLLERDSQLAFAHTLLRAATEGSLDAILVVDSQARIVSYTQRFIDLWSVPLALVRSGNDAPVLATVTERIKDAAAYRARVEYLYAHPDEESRDRIETKDGRVIDRYTRSLYGSDGEYLGRIWFFRDITEQEKAAAALKESEGRFRAIFSGTRDGISLADRATRRFYLVNQSFCAMVGYGADELAGASIELIHPADRLGMVFDAFERQAKGELDVALDLPIRRKDGSVFYADVNSTPVVIGDRTYLLGVFRDVTERKAVEDKLKFVNTLLEAEIESAPDAVLVVQNDLKSASYNKNFLDMFAISAEVEASHDADAVLTATLPKLVDPDAFWRDVHTVREHPDIRIEGRETELKSGRCVEYYGATIHGPAREAFGRIWFFRDITDRKSAERQIRVMNTVLAAQVESAPDGVLVISQDRRILLYNQRFVDMWRLPPDIVSQKNDSGAIAAVLDKLEDPQGFLKRVNELYEHPGERSYDEIRLKDGRVFERHSGPMPDSNGKTLGRIWFFRDVTERHEAEVAVRRSEEKYRNLVESSTDFVWEIDAEGRYTYYSPAARALLGYASNELTGTTPFSIMAPAEAERVKAIFTALVADKKPFSMLENTVLTKNGVPVVMETSGVPIFDKNGVYCGYRGIERDITQRKNAESELKSRDALLHAVAVSAAALVAAPSLDEAMAHALATVGETLKVDRMMVLERPSELHAPPTLRYVWHAPQTSIIVDDAFFKASPIAAPELLRWHQQLSQGKAVTLRRSTAPPEFRKFIDALAIASMLILPVMVDGRYWGQISMHSCDSERIWRAFEIDILATLADLIGNLIQRERYVQEIANANRIVQNTPTILYRLQGIPSLPLIYVSQNIRLFGYEPAVLTEAPLLYQNLVHPSDIAIVRETLGSALEGGVASGSFEFRLLTGHGEYRWVENRYTPIRDSAGRLIEIEGLLIDVTERKTAEDRIALLARTDSLTGLANRNTFVERLRQFFVAARRGGPPFALHYIDLDRFKDINDTLGHPVGDRFLTEMAARLKTNVREGDLVGRLGGDEFAILQADVTDSAAAGALAAKIRARLAEPVQIDGTTLYGTVSIGIAISGPSTTVPEELLAQADIALYRAKEEGRDQYRFHTEALDLEVREQVRLIEDLRVAQRRGDFELYYQPQVELSGGRIVGMEALLRWHHPTRGLLPASLFIPIAERAGMVAEIGRWVLERACEQMHAWRQQGVAPEVIAVNVSAGEIRSADEYTAAVRSALDRWGIEPTSLELDVTESTLARVTFAQNDALERLQKLGVGISIDDFGTKYSSLDYLRTYRVNRLKIPPELTAAAAHDPDSAAMVRAIIGIARELDIDVVAQGIEQESQWAFLSTTSPATKVQGYFYSEPVSAERAEEMLRRRSIQPTDAAR